MIFREFRDKAEWVALAGGVLIVAGQWWLHSHYVDRVIWVDRTPPELKSRGILAHPFDSSARIPNVASMAVVRCSYRVSVGHLYFYAGTLRS